MYNSKYDTQHVNICFGLCALSLALTATDGGEEWGGEAGSRLTHQFTPFFASDDIDPEAKLSSHIEVCERSGDGAGRDISITIGEDPS